MLKESKREVVELYLKHPEHRDLDLGFPSRGGDHREHSMISKIFKRAMKKAGLGGFTPHNLRHTFASFLFSMTENILHVSKVLGHSNPSITLKVYAKLLKKDDSAITEHINTSFATFFNKGVPKVAKN